MSPESMTAIKPSIENKEPAMTPEEAEKFLANAELILEKSKRAAQEVDKVKKKKEEVLQQYPQFNKNPDPVIQPVIQAPEADPITEPEPVSAGPSLEELAETAKREHAQRIAEKIKHKPFSMKQDDWDFERDKSKLVDDGQGNMVPENRKLIDDALKSMSVPVEAPKPENEIKAPEIITDRERRKAEYGRILDEKGGFAATMFSLKEDVKATKERIKGLGAKQQERIGKISGKAAAGGIMAGILAFDVMKQGVKALKTEGSKSWELLKKKFAEKREPKDAMGILKEWVGIKTANEQKKIDEAAAKLEKEKLADGEKKQKILAEKDPNKEAREELEYERRAFMEWALMQKLEGADLKRWEAAQPIPAIWFMEPTKGEWGFSGGQKIIRTEMPGIGKRFQEALRPHYEAEVRKGTDMSKWRLKDLATLAARATEKMRPAVTPYKDIAKGEPSPVDAFNKVFDTKFDKKQAMRKMNQVFVEHELNKTLEGVSLKQYNDAQAVSIEWFVNPTGIITFKDGKKVEKSVDDLSLIEKDLRNLLLPTYEKMKAQGLIDKTVKVEDVIAYAIEHTESEPVAAAAA